jgi:hypothetical protein
VASPCIAPTGGPNRTDVIYGDASERSAGHAVTVLSRCHVAKVPQHAWESVAVRRETLECAPAGTPLVDHDATSTEADEATSDGGAVEPRHAAESRRSALDFSDVIVDHLDETVQNTATEPQAPPLVRSPVTRMIGPP